MKKLMLSSIVTILLVSQFLGMQEARAELLYPVEIDHQPVKVRISRIKIQYDGEQLILSGLIKRRAYNSHVLPGHIDYVVLNKNNGILHEGAIKVHGLNLRKNRYGRQFNILLPVILPGGSHIKIG